MASGFDPRPTWANRHWEAPPPMNLIGRCKGCKKGARVTVELGYACFERPDPVPFFGPNHAAFRCPDGTVLQAYSLQHACGAYMACKGCGTYVKLEPVRGRVVPEKVCDGRCMGATGPSCDCACGGKHHGSAHG